ncbi:MAG: hypothetical protein LBC83_01470 [Oscillospiraceae bacterium]|nr:hypothetical protein [Oscillospiraceae bacterium]
MALRRRIYLLPLCACLLFLVSCKTEQWQDIRLFCERYTALAEDKSTLRTEDFLLEQAAGGGQRWQASPGSAYLITLEARGDGRVHTASLTASPDFSTAVFNARAKQLLEAYTAAAPDQCARWLYATVTGTKETEGFSQWEEAGFRFAYAAGGAGYYLRVSRLEYLPEEDAVPTLREPVRSTPVQ